MKTSNTLLITFLVIFGIALSACQLGGGNSIPATPTPPNVNATMTTVPPTTLPSQQPLTVVVLPSGQPVPYVASNASAPAGSPNVIPADFSNLEKWTVPNDAQPFVSGTYTVKPGEIAALWWAVKVLNSESFNLEKTGNCHGFWLSPGTYKIEAAGRIRVWAEPSADQLTAFMNWWETTVQNEAGNICTYDWVQE